MITHSDFYRIWLSSLTSLRQKTRVALETAFDSPEAAFACRDKIEKYIPVTRSEAKAFAVSELETVDLILAECEAAGISVITIDNPAYPERLKNIYAPPEVIYVSGALPDIDSIPVIAVIGTRKADDFGLQMGEKLALEISRCGGTVLSLLTRGVDAAAAKGALRSDRPCIGVIGTSHDKCTSRLAGEVAERGAVISEYPPGTDNKAEFYRERNRLASGLSIATVVVEAPEKSGTFYFVAEALDQGKDVYAVPVNALSPNGSGTLKLLREGAKAVACGWDVMAEYALQWPDIVRRSPEAEPVRNTKKTAKTASEPVRRPAMPAGRAEKAREKTSERRGALIAALSETEIKVFNAVEGGENTMDGIIFRTELPAAKVLSTLTVMELKQVISRDAANHITLNL